MKKHFILLLLLSINIPFAHSEITNSEKIILNGLGYLYNMEFQKAEGLFDQLIKAYPDDPEGYFFKSSIYSWLLNLDPAHEENSEKFKELSDLTIEIAKKRLKNNKNDIDAMFYLGGAYGNLGMYYTRNNNMLKAIWNGRKGMNYLMDVVKKDRMYYDAYLGLGIFHYYLGKFPGLLKTLSKIVGVGVGDIERGLLELKIAMNRGKYARTEATFYLGFIKRQFENEPIESEKLFRQLVENYPNNIFFLGHLGYSYLINNKFNDAIKTISEIKTSENSKPYPNFVKNTNMIVVWANIALNKFDKAIECYSKYKEMIDDKDMSIPEYNQLIYDIGTCYEIIGKREEALSFYKMIQKENDKSLFERAQRRIAESLSAVEIDETIANNYQSQNKPDSAIYIYERAITKMDSGHVGYGVDRQNNIYYNMGICNKELQEYEKANFWFNEVLKQEDKTLQKEAKDALNELEEMIN